MEKKTVEDSNTAVPEVRSGPQEVSQPITQTPGDPKQTHRFVIGISVLALLFLGTTGFFAYQNYQLRKQILQPRPTPAVFQPTTTIEPATAPTTNWEKIISTRCGFEIQYPDGWYARETKLVSGTDNPELHYGCVDILSPDYNFEDEKKVGSSLPKEFYIKISRTKLGAEFKSVEINSLEDYIEVEESIWEPPASVDYKTSVFGDISGKEYIFGGFGTFHNFIFKQGDYIFNASWPVGHEEDYGKEDRIDQMFSTFKFLE